MNTTHHTSHTMGRVARTPKALAVAVAASAILGSTSVGTAGAATESPLGGVFAGPALDVTKAATAPVDECFKSIGDDIAPAADGSCATGYQEKINEGYMWSGVRSGDFAYFGTSANAICGAEGQMNPEPTPALLEDGNVCEFGEGAGTPVFGPRMGDSRLSRVLRVNADTQRTEDVSPTDDTLFQQAAGLRGAAAANDVVFMFGIKTANPTDPRAGLSVFAFEGSTGRFLGSALRTDLISARQAVVASDGNLYIAGRSSNGTSGTILRWTGDKADPFRFETVGTLANDAGYLTTMGNRLVVSGWPGIKWGEDARAVGESAKLWISPEIPAGGLTAADAASWQPFFSWDQYDPDPVVGKSIVWGAIKEWRGDLYVGSYNHIAGTATASLWSAYGRPSTEAARMLDMTNSARPATIFRISKPGTPEQKVTLLYGDTLLPVYNPDTRLWVKKPNRLGQVPKFGLSGFGNPANQYAWTFTTFQDKLYMSTFDASGTLAPAAFVTQRVLGLSSATRTSLEKVVGPALFNSIGGGDVWRMDDPAQPAVAETLNGFGNRAQHGVRIFLPFEDKGFLYAGMASSWNLRATDKNRGGWELNKLTPGAVRPGLNLSVPANAIQGVLGAFAGGVE
ncbi:hypothetical protein AB0M28_14030 [Streptomyces sp. NPDC051940]|uniref:hypothetical protein n=1 Tax=Streptomyces sp. NPDC051940 TaxID=3155675 RepID=UPI003415CD8E